MRKKVLQINDWDVSQMPVVYTCYGLGSCVGLFIKDSITGISGGAHIPMPTNTGLELQDATSIIEDLVSTFLENGSRLENLQAKITGGAQIYQCLFSVGLENVQMVTSVLSKNGIPITASDVGGRISRTARFNTLTGELKISTSELKTYII